MKPQTNAKIKSVPAGFITEKIRAFKHIDQHATVDVALNKVSNSFKLFLKGILHFLQLLFLPQTVSKNLLVVIPEKQFNPNDSYVFIIGERYKN
ncbi:MAG: hypothetical protein RI922_1951 [Bacteroidota bacterium]|jgi:hypothetical protein